MSCKRFCVGDHVLARGTSGSEYSGYIVHPYFEDSDYVTIRLDFGKYKDWCANCFSSSLKHLKSNNPISIQLELDLF